MDKGTTPVYVYPNRSRIVKIKQEKVKDSSTSISKKNNKSIDEIDLTVNNNPLKNKNNLHCLFLNLQNSNIKNSHAWYQRLAFPSLPLPYHSISLM